jgi:hypothetical protein
MTALPNNPPPADEADGFNTYVAPKTHWLTTLRLRLGIIGELIAFLWRVRLWWLIPMIVILVLFLVVFVVLPASPLAPFLYPLR